MVFTCSQFKHNLEFDSFQAIFAGGWLGALRDNQDPNEY
jgi:hypothetical protein